MKKRLRKCIDDGSDSGIESVDNLGDGLAADRALGANYLSAFVAHAAMAARNEHGIDLVREAHFA